MKCPFREAEKVKQFWTLVDLYNKKSGHLFTNGKPSRGNGFATDFWGGYAGETTGIFNYAGRSSRVMTGYTWYRTGQVIKAAGL